MTVVKVAVGEYNFVPKEKLVRLELIDKGTRNLFQ